MRRRGFALIAVLWVVVALASLTAGAVSRARADASLTGKSVAQFRGRWAAEACLAVAHNRIEVLFRSSRMLAKPPVDTLAFANGTRCTVEAVDPGTRALRDSLGPWLTARLDSILAAQMADPGTLFTSYGDGRLNVNTAPPVLLSALPGIGSEALREISNARAWDRPITDLDDLSGRLSAAGRSVLNRGYGNLSRRLSFNPSALVVTSTGWSEGAATPTELTIQVLFANAGVRAALVQRSMW